MATKKREITALNIYEILNVMPDASETEIRRAYRKKALKVHPDKNKNDPKANALFHELSEALEILLDSTARTAYDKLLQARERAKLRDQQLNAKRRKLKEDLERREKEATNMDLQASLAKSEKSFQAEVDRLRREGSRVLEEEQERLRQKLVEDLLAPVSSEQYDESMRQLWVTWKTGQGLKNYTLDEIKRIFYKYGDCDVIFSKKKPGKALIEFVSSAAASQAVQFEKGMSDGPLHTSYRDGSVTPRSAARKQRVVHETSLEDFEEQVLRQMKETEALQKKANKASVTTEQPC